MSIKSAYALGRSRAADKSSTRLVDVRSTNGRSGSRCERIVENDPMQSLSRREGEVLSWLAHGKSGPEIAIILGISTCTVRLHIQSTKRKLNASNIPHAVSRGFLLGILRNKPVGS